MPRYNQYNRNRLSLNTVGFQPTVFTPIEFRPVEQDYSILERAMAKQEERKEKAVTQQSLVKQALGKAREQLYQDDKTLTWFDARARKIEDNIKTAAEVGDYATALQTGIEAAGDIANDTELNARIRTNAQYKEEYNKQRDRIGKGISQETFNWWAEKNPYKHTNIYNNGEITGAEDWKAEFTPVDDIKWEGIYALATQLTKPEKGSTGSSSNVDKNGVIKDITTTGSNQYERLSPEDIAATAQSIIGNNWDALVQDFNVQTYRIEKLNKEIISLPENNPERLLKEQQLANLNLLLTGDNCIALANNKEGWITYYTRMVEKGLYSQPLSYNWTFKEGSSIGRYATNPNPNAAPNDGYNNRQSATGSSGTAAGSNNMPQQQTPEDESRSAANAAISAIQQF